MKANQPYLQLYDSTEFSISLSRDHDSRYIRRRAGGTRRRRRTPLAVAPRAFFSPLLEPHRPRVFYRCRSFIHLETEEMAGGKGSRQGHTGLTAALRKGKGRLDRRRRG